MLDRKTLRKIALAEMIRVFGRKYLQINYDTTCTAEGMVADDTYRYFLGVKSAKELPGRKATPQGWVVYGLVFLDANTGAVKKLEYELEGIEKSIMYDMKTLRRIAVEELIRVFGRKYLEETNSISCTAEGMVTDDTYQLFLGIKDSDDLPGRKATPKGWVVYGLIFLDANTGEVKKFEYELE